MDLGISGKNALVTRGKQGAWAAVRRFAGGLRA